MVFVLLAVTLSLLRHVRQSYRPHTAVLLFDPAHGWTTAPAISGHETEPGLILYRFGADLFYANATRFADEARALVDGAPHPVRWLVIEADAITNLDYTAARVSLVLIEELARQKIGFCFARVQRIASRRYGSAWRHCRCRRTKSLCHPPRSSSRRGRFNGYARPILRVDGAACSSALHPLPRAVPLAPVRRCIGARSSAFAGGRHDCGDSRTVPSPVLRDE